MFHFVFAKIRFIFVSWKTFGKHFEQKHSKKMKNTQKQNLLKMSINN